MNNLTKVKINVTQEHIDKAVCKDAEFCAIAEACKEVFGLVSVGLDFLTIICDDTYNLFDMPTIVKKSIRKFDKGKDKCKPFSFEIYIDLSIFDNHIEDILERIENSENISIEQEMSLVENN